MRHAFVDNKLQEASANLKGTCPGCFKPVTPKCGQMKVHHWAHANNKSCDSWWEPETEWHRTWKNNFPINWQENFLHDKLTGEKHIADVRTDHGLIIEFQHSYLNLKERTSREKFYQNMVWVIDGSRLKGDFNRFLNGMSYFRTNKKNIFHLDCPEKCFPQSWLKCSVPVIFDFINAQSVEELNDLKNDLYCLFPLLGGRISSLAKISRTAFIKNVMNGEWTLRSRQFTSEIAKDNKIRKDIEALHRLRFI